MPQPSYAYAVARLRVLEARLLPREKLMQIVDAQDAAEALRILVEGGIGGALQVASAHEYEALLREDLLETRELIRAITPEPQTTARFFYQYDCQNLKILFKLRALGRDGGEEMLSPLGEIAPEELARKVREKDYKELPGPIAQGCAVIENMLLEAAMDPKRLSAILDRAYFATALEGLKKGFLRDYFTAWIDLINIRTVLRLRRAGGDRAALEQLTIPGGGESEQTLARALEESDEGLIQLWQFRPFGPVVVGGIEALQQTGTLAGYERAMDDYLMALAREGKGELMSIRPILGYWLAKESQNRQLRQIMIGKLNGIAPDAIRERLRETYG